VTYTYDGADWRTQMMDPLGTTTWSYDAADRLLTANQYGRTVSSAWDAAGLLTGLTDPEGVQQTYGYDAAHRLVSVTRLGKTITYRYNAAGLHTGATFPNGITASYSYDDATGSPRSITCRAPPPFSPSPTPTTPWATASARPSPTRRGPKTTSMFLVKAHKTTPEQDQRMIIFLKGQLQYYGSRPGGTTFTTLKIQQVEGMHDCGGGVDAQDL
jgi:YD repeat-containing protein